MTIVPAEPSIEPALARLSKSIGTSISSAVSTGVEDPPGITHRSCVPVAHAAAVALVRR